ncbi:ubiquinol-cytochrome c reductase complex assembly factor 2 [Periplaneta americana]|uniref:ubiquinol-cytochrome c reductase complex assembly factor 2 n=1 Tax=Periplaneta americana TaxID=6978 RepID=UPI0037E84154
MAKSYKQFLHLLENWPADTTKIGRDLGQHLRQQVKEAFKAGEINQVNEEECNKVYASLKRLSDNEYGQMYQRKSNSCASGLTADECKALLSTEFLEELKQSEQGFFSKLFYKKTN